jgi:hypothetical protein
VGHVLAFLDLGTGEVLRRIQQADPPDRFLVLVLDGDLGLSLGLGAGPVLEQARCADVRQTAGLAGRYDDGLAREPAHLGPDVPGQFGPHREHELEILGNVRHHLRRGQPEA